MRSLAVTVASRVYEPEAGAAAFRLGALVRALEAAGHRVTVLTTRPKGAFESSRRIRRWPVLRDRSGVVRGYVQYASFDIPLYFRLLFARRADVVVVEPPPTTGLVARWACWLRRTPYVYFSADVLSSAVAGIGLSSTVVRMVRALERASLRGASGVLAVSDGVAEAVVELGAARDSVTVVGTGIDTARFRPDGPIHREEFPYLVYAGTMSEVHGAGVFIDAFALVAAQHPDARLIMFGGGVEFDELRERAASSGAAHRILVHPTIDPEELGAWLRGASASLASVRPGSGYDFAFATKALASLRCGTPVLYAGVGPLSSQIEQHRLGWTAEWEPHAVSTAMDSALGRTPVAPDQRLAEWVEATFSSHAVSERAVVAIERAARRR